MRILITGVCGYVGSRLAAQFAAGIPGVQLLGLDNLSRRGSELHRPEVEASGVECYHGDVRVAADLRALPAADWVVDCAANPSVTAGLASAGRGTAEQLTQHNLGGTLHLLEYCRSHGAGLVLLSTSRVYSIPALCALPLQETPTRLSLAPPEGGRWPAGVSEAGINEAFSTAPPLSLYGATKLASEVMAAEYGLAFDFPVWINRCGVIGGPGQLGRPDQGILSYWVYSCCLGKPLRYLGFGGTGKQVRDCMPAEDVGRLVMQQMNDPGRPGPRVLNLGGGVRGSFSLLELTRWCEAFLGRAVDVQSSSQARAFDIPYYVADHRLAAEMWGWQPSHSAEEMTLDLCRWVAGHHSFVERVLE